jgi:iron complex outermembrane receptor protein
MNKLLFLFSALLFPSLFFAQIIGRVTDADRKAIAYCNVALIRTTDSTLVTGATTDTSGSFQLEIKATGSFRLLITYVGYRKYYSAPIPISEQMYVWDAGTQILLPGNQLGDVQIVAEKAFVEHLLDRTVYNMHNSIISAGNNGLEILKKLSGVTVDNSDAIQVRGKSGVLVMLEGRNTYMSAADLAGYLKSLDAGQIEKIEVITNPSAKYDASGNAIINIILKKDKNLGFNGQASLTWRQSNYYGGGANLNGNYRTRKFNFFGFYNLGKGQNAGYTDQRSIFNASGSTPSTYADHMLRLSDGLYQTFRLGLDYTANKRQTLGFSAELNTTNDTRTLSNASDIYNAKPLPDSVIERAGQVNAVNYRASANLYYTFKIDSSGRELSVNGDFAFFNNRYHETDISTYSYPSSSRNQTQSTLRFSLPGTLRILAAKADYVHPWSKNNKLEGGLKVSMVNTDNNALYWNVVQAAEIPDKSKTNHFIYSEAIYSAYMNYSKKFSEKLEGQFGLRGETTQTRGTQTLTDSTVSRTYTNFFPSLFLSWKADSNSVFNLSYSRRIDRPDYGSLNPFLFYQSPYTYYTGNPYLLPQISDNVEISHQYKGFLSSSLGYLYMQNVMSEAIRQNPLTHISVRSGTNLPLYEAYNLLESVTLHPTAWWTSVTSINAFHDHYYGNFQGNYYSKKGYTAYFNLSNSFQFKKGWGLEISFFYRTVNIDALMINDPIYRADIGIRKRIAHGRGTISLNAADLFWSDQNTGTQIFQNVNYRGINYTDSRRFRITFSWKFGKSEYQRQEKRKGAEEELKRGGK